MNAALTPHISGLYDEDQQQTHNEAYGVWLNKSFQCHL